ncbi:hypothetical protein ID866_5874 [Astraeus odoratus]|nr:hypothetical protein ID866_5874 [Astraeus odoratus]
MCFALANYFTDSNYHFNFHGEQCARLNVDQSVHGWKYEPSKTMIICAPLLFFSPMTSVRQLHTIFVDGIACKDTWNAFVNQLTSQLGDTNLLATVLLNANVGFLAINSVDSGAGISLRQISSYLSLMTSFASIILGLILVRHNRTESRNSVFAAAKFLGSLHHEKHGLETLAIIYSLPHAFLIWGMVLFFTALSAEWWNPGDLVSWVTIGTASSAVFILVGWCIWTARDKTHHWWFQPDAEPPSVSDSHEGCQNELGSLWSKMFHYIAKLLKTMGDHCSIFNEKGSVDEVNLHGATAPPTGLPRVAPNGDAIIDGENGDAASVASSPVVITVRRPTLLSNGDG